MIDWTQYETNEIAPGIFALDEEQGERLMAEVDPPADRLPCVTCGGATYRPHTFSRMRLCRPCDAIQPPSFQVPKA